MFIPKLENGTFNHNVLVYIPEELIQSVWNNIISNYVSFIKSSFQNVSNSVLLIPLTMLDDATEFKEYCEEMNEIIAEPNLYYNIYMDIPYVNEYVTDISRRKLIIPSKREKYQIELKLTNYLMDVFAQRMDVIFSHKLTNPYPKMMFLYNIPDSDETAKQALSTLTQSNYAKNSRVKFIGFKKTAFKNKSTYYRMLGELCSAAADSVAKSSYDSRNIKSSYTKLLQLHNSKCTIINPHSFAGLSVSTQQEYGKSIFKVVMYRNGKLFTERGGIVTGDSLMEMQWKILKIIDRGRTSDEWVVVCGMVSYLLDEDK